MNGYLLDTNICVAFFKTNPNVLRNIEHAGDPDLAISETTLAELIYGVVKSARPDHHRAILDDFLDGVAVLPIRDCLEAFAEEKVRLGRLGTPVDNFDLLIGATALHHGLTLVTNNTKHFQRLKGIKLENWTK